MVKVSTPSKKSYCIDSTEVTKGQYGAFLEASPRTDAQPAQCAWNTSLVPSRIAGEVTPEELWPFPPGQENDPVDWVDWCDARAYCSWAGKRLCGRVGGGSNAVADHAHPERSQWFNACSAGGARVYPYGNKFSADACKGIDRERKTSQTKAAARCKGAEPPFDRVFDLSGNVREWEDSCKDNDPPPGSGCLLRGGGANAGGTDADQLRCDANLWVDITTAAAAYGFRCCADL
jgi:formylglycine-generating enzyme